jgi:hypothetical protein
MSGFRFVKDAAVWWPVRWQEPADGGETVEASIELKFRRLGVSEAEALTSLSNLEFVSAAATDWRGALDGEGKPVPFSKEWVAAWLDIPPVAAAVAASWARFLSAQPEIRVGNSAASPGGGPGEAAPTAAATTSKPRSGKRSAKPA